MKNLTVAMKLGLGFGAVLVLMGIMGMFALNKMNLVNQQSTDIASNWMPSIRFVEEINTSTSDFRIAELQHVVSEKPEEMEAAEKAMTNILASLKEDRAAYEKLISSEQERAIYNEFARQYDAYLAIHDKMIPLSRQLKTKEAMELMNGESKKLFDDSSANLLKLVEINIKGGNDASAAGDVMYDQARVMVIGFIVVGVFIGIAVAFFITRNLLKALGGEPDAAVEIANMIAIGDLSANIELNSGDTTSVFAAMKNMSDTLKGLLTDTDVLVRAAAEGELDTRADANKYQGDFRKLVAGINDTLDGVIDPVNEAVDVLKEMEQGNLTQTVNGDYK
ncbi:MAG: MCP four helix bundle domain-containing protein, partial [Methylobacter sp.]